MLKLLVVDDTTTLPQLVTRGFPGDAVVVHAQSIRQATNLYLAHTGPEVISGGFDGIVVDSCVPGFTLNTDHLVSRLRNPSASAWYRRPTDDFPPYAGPIVGVSPSDRFREELLLAGCDAVCGRSDNPQQILEAFGKARQVRERINQERMALAV
jgi:hypothetical protein